jgi:hypothetical protein
MTTVSELTRGGIPKILEMESPKSNKKEIFLQVLQVKLFDESRKGKIKLR